jgi:nucleoid-associated protein YgaU
MLADDPQILEARIPEPDLNLYDSLFEDKNHDPKDPDIQTPNDQDNKPADDPDQTRHP